MRNRMHKYSDQDTLILIIIAMFLPPLAAYLAAPRGSKAWILNMFLSLISLGLLGFIHALFLIFRDWELVEKKKKNKKFVVVPKDAAKEEKKAIKKKAKKEERKVSFVEI